MLACANCGMKQSTIKALLQHMNLHRNSTSLQCGISGCHWRGSRYTSFKAHISYCHSHLSASQSNLRQNLPVFTFTCSFPSCQKTFKALKLFLSHTYKHFESGNNVSCPFSACTKVYSNLSSFRCHLHRSHLKPGLVSISNLDSYCQVNEVPHGIAEASSLEVVNSGEVNADCLNTMEADTSALAQVIKEPLPQLIADFYLMLQAKYFLASSTVQVISQCMVALHERSIHELKQKLQDALSDRLSLQETQTIVNEVCLCDTFTSSHDPTIGPLRSHKTRKTFFKEKCLYVAPERHTMGRNKKGVESYFHYISIERSLKQMLADNNIVRVLKDTNYSCNSDMFCDYTDGSMYKGTSNFHDCINLFLYQDEFELVNPLGQAKTVHKVLAFYYSIGNIAVQFRSNVDHIQLVLLCKSVDYKYFGAQRILTPLFLNLRNWNLMMLCCMLLCFLIHGLNSFV
jgi:hypothetical protein